MDSIQDKLMQQFQKMDLAYENYAKSKNMTYLNLIVLEEIYLLGDGCTQKEIVDDTFYPKQTINLVIKAFLKEDIIILKEKEDNRKNKGIFLTEKGKKLSLDIIAPLIKQEEKTIASIGEEESRELLRIIELYSKKYCDLINNLS